MLYPCNTRNKDIAKPKSPGYHFSGSKAAKEPEMREREAGNTQTDRRRLCNSRQGTCSELQLGSPGHAVWVYIE